MTSFFSLGFDLKTNNCYSCYSFSLYCPFFNDKIIQYLIAKLFCPGVMIIQNDQSSGEGMTPMISYNMYDH